MTPTTAPTTAPTCTPRRTGFTLVELAVVVVILGGLITAMFVILGDRADTVDTDAGVLVEDIRSGLDSTSDYALTCPESLGAEAIAQLVQDGQCVAPN
jgi:prepilin-type N-terminal cleavage/methylation domain-containing protein